MRDLTKKSREMLKVLTDKVVALPVYRKDPADGKSPSLVVLDDVLAILQGEVNG